VALSRGARSKRSSSRLADLDARPGPLAFAHGGKDGTPFPVDRETYDRRIETLKAALKSREVDRRERVAPLRGSPS
jgi:hypothetical protein